MEEFAGAEYRAVVSIFAGIMYYIVFGLLYFISLLPLFILYSIGDFIFLIIYFVFGYRKEVVMQNLRNAFPEKKPEELVLIARRFYHNFIDNWIETIKLLSISRRSLNKRASGNFEVFHELQKKYKSVQLNAGHFFNWEIMTLHTGINQPYTFLTVYLPQNNQIINRLLLYLRSRWGNPQLPATDMARAIMPWRKKGYLVALGADQSPAHPEAGYWLYFMHQPTVFLKGTEKFARSQDVPVVMLTTTHNKRGHYQYNYFLLAENPRELPEGELIRRYVKQLEDNIRLQPDIYLWSHKRWKHSWKAEYEKLWVDTKPAPGGK